MEQTEQQKRTRSLLESGVLCTVLLLAASVACGLIGTKIDAASETVPLLDNAFKCMLLCTVFVCCGLAVYWKFEDRMTENRLIALLFLLVFAARLCYILEIGITTNQHDTSWFGKTENNYGHTGYIRYLLEEGHLPDFNVIGKSQFYHPPLHHIVCALWLKAQTAVGIAFETAAENLQILTLFYSMVTLYASYRILKLLGMKNTPLIAALCLLGFHPTFFLFSGSINNDCMSVMFAFLAVWAALEWWKKPSFGKIALLALCIGCAMFAKLATGIIAPAVAFLFLHRLLTTKGGKNKGMLLLQFCLFGVLCIPLGIGWQVRNYLLYDVPLTYVPKLSAKADQYLGGYSVTSRFFDWESLADFGVYPMRTGTQGAEYFEHCIPLALLKMSLFGEYSVWKDYPFFDAASNVLFLGNLLIVLATLVGMVWVAVKLVRTRSGEAFAEEFGFSRTVAAFFLLYWGSMMVSYVPFCFEYPHFCSMDFRYVVPTLLTGAVFFGVLYRKLEQRSGRLWSALRAVLLVSVGAFAVCSLCIYPLYFS